MPRFRVPPLYPHRAAGPLQAYNLHKVERMGNVIQMLRDPNPGLTLTLTLTLIGSSETQPRRSLRSSLRVWLRHLTSGDWSLWAVFRRGAAAIIATISQNNRKVQAEATAQGALQYVAHMSVHDKDATVRTKVGS